MEIEYIHIKRFNLEIEKAYAIGLTAIHIHLIPMVSCCKSLCLLNFIIVRRLNRQISFVYSKYLYGVFKSTNGMIIIKVVPIFYYL